LASGRGSTLAVMPAMFAAELAAGSNQTTHLPRKSAKFRGAHQWIALCQVSTTQSPEPPFRRNKTITQPQMVQ
jgi:hypothetical protein